jgi:hypothetical protein
VTGFPFRDARIPGSTTAPPNLRRAFFEGAFGLRGKPWVLDRQTVVEPDEALNFWFNPTVFAHDAEGRNRRAFTSEVNVPAVRLLFDLADIDHSSNPSGKEYLNRADFGQVKLFPSSRNPDSWKVKVL